MAVAHRLARDRALFAQRKALSEYPFGTIKRAMDQGYFLLKGLRKVRGEFSLTVLAYNLKRVLNLVGCHGCWKPSRSGTSPPFFRPQGPGRPPRTKRPAEPTVPEAPLLIVPSLHRALASRSIATSFHTASALVRQPLGHPFSSSHSDSRTVHTGTQSARRTPR